MELFKEEVIRSSEIVSKPYILPTSSRSLLILAVRLFFAKELAEGLIVLVIYGRTLVIMSLTILDSGDYVIMAVSYNIMGSTLGLFSLVLQPRDGVSI